MCISTLAELILLSGSISTAPENFEVHVVRVGCLDLKVHPVELVAELVPRHGIYGLRTDAGIIRGPEKTENRGNMAMFLGISSN